MALELVRLKCDVTPANGVVPSLLLDRSAAQGGLIADGEVTSYLRVRVLVDIGMVPAQLGEVASWRRAKDWSHIANRIRADE